MDGDKPPPGFRSVAMATGTPASTRARAGAARARGLHDRWRLRTSRRGLRGRKRGPLRREAVRRGGRNEAPPRRAVAPLEVEPSRAGGEAPGAPTEGSRPRSTKGRQAFDSRRVEARNASCWCTSSRMCAPTPRPSTWRSAARAQARRPSRTTTSPALTTWVTAGVPTRNRSGVVLGGRLGILDGGEEAPAPQVPEDAPHRALEHLAHVAGLQMTEPLPDELTRLLFPGAV